MFDILNSNFFSAFFGAIAGALAAAWLAWHTETRRQLKDEILACNVAINQCAAIANSFVAVKRQTVRPVCLRYALQSIALFFHGVNVGGGVLEIALDFNVLTSPWTSIDTLNGIISTRIWSAAQPSALAASLSQAIHNQRNATERRNEIGQKIAACQPNEKTARYFGLRLPTGGLDTSYPDIMSGLYSYTDDCIYFPALLAAVLTAHGNALAAKLGRSAPRIKTLDLSAVQRDGLLPEPAQYPEFESVYRPKDPELVVGM
ncbi:MAG TPA: hypothetical protein VHT03_06405 [Rhizomicrobium sp.]|nr:hypothetical protein [Rhizomicrobium sp.]